jgi:hypothetical protein
MCGVIKNFKQLNKVNYLREILNNSVSLKYKVSG